MKTVFFLFLSLTFAIQMNGQIEGTWFNHDNSIFSFQKIEGKANYYKITAFGTKGVALFNPDTNELVFKAQAAGLEYTGYLQFLGANMTGYAYFMGIKIPMYLSRSLIPNPEIPPIVLPN